LVFCPLIFYYVLDERGLRWLFRYTLLAGFASGLAIFLSMVILCLQIASVQEMSLDGSHHIQRGFLNGVNHLLFALERRTYAKTGGGPEYSASLTSLIQMLWIYLKGSFFDIPNYFNIQSPLLAKALPKVRYCYVILVSFVASGFSSTGKAGLPVSTEGAPRHWSSQHGFQYLLLYHGFSSLNNTQLFILT